MTHKYLSFPVDAAAVVSQLPKLVSPDFFGDIVRGLAVPHVMRAWVRR
jgi:hypothetical protein